MKTILLVGLELAADADTLLRRTDLSIGRAASAEQALASHRRERADLIAVDLDALGSAGERLCAELREDERLRRVSLLVVASDTSAGREQAERCRANAVLWQPLSTPELSGTIGRLLAIPERASYRVLLRARVQAKQPQPAFFCTSGNLSAGGMLLETERALLAGDRLSLSFFLPGHAQVELEGEVVRTAPRPEGGFRYGVRFTHLARADRAAIEGFVDARRA